MILLTSFDLSNINSDKKNISFGTIFQYSATRTIEKAYNNSSKFISYIGSSKKNTRKRVPDYQLFQKIIDSMFQFEQDGRHNLRIKKGKRKVQKGKIPCLVLYSCKNPSIKYPFIDLDDKFCQNFVGLNPELVYLRFNKFVQQNIKKGNQNPISHTIKDKFLPFIRAKLQNLVFRFF